MFGSSKQTPEEQQRMDTHMVHEPIPLDPHPVEHDPRPGMHPHDRNLVSPQTDRRAMGNPYPRSMAGQPEPLAHAHREIHPQPAMHSPGMQEAMQSPGLDGLEPVMSSEEAQRLRGQWDALQVRFVEDPRAAVTEARALVHGSLDRLTERLQMRTQVLERGMSQQGEASTETLRLALKGYRELLEHVLAFGQK